MKKNERTLQMIDNYMSLRESGMSNPEIAKKYNLSNWTVYNYLGEIAKKNGVSRESLLDTPHSQHITYERVSEPAKPLNISGFTERIQNALAIMDELKGLVRMAIEDTEKCRESLEGGTEG